MGSSVIGYHIGDGDIRVIEIGVDTKAAMSMV